MIYRADSETQSRLSGGSAGGAVGRAKRGIPAGVAADPDGYAIVETGGSLAAIRVDVNACCIVRGVASHAHDALKDGLTAVDNVLSFAKTGAGKPSAKERSLFVASVALSYAVWENFAEDLLIEGAEFLSTNISPRDVPETAKVFISRDAATWDIAVHPGWRALWVVRIRERAKGREDEDRSFGLLTADVAGLQKLYRNAGLDPFDGLEKAKLDELDELVKLRGEIVHTGKAPRAFVKADAVGSKQVVEDLAEHADTVVADQVKSMIGTSPW
jgi:hypothetical protein